MKGLLAKYPILLGLVFFLVAMIAVVPVMFALQTVGIPVELAAALARIIIGVAIIGLFNECFDWGKISSGLRFALPVLVIVAWNVVYHLMSGSELVAPGDIPNAIVLGFAPAIFEEAIFRGVIIGKMREGGKGTMYSLVASAALFSVVHLTNIAGMTLANVLVQVLYSFVIGLLFGAIYLRSGDIESVILGHAAIDVSNQVFTTSPSTTSVPMLVAFAVVLIALAAYSLWLVRGTDKVAQA